METGAADGQWPARGTPSVDDVDDLTAVDPLQVDRGDPEVGMPELALDHIQWDALSRHFNGVGVAQLVWREAAANTGQAPQAPELRPRRRSRPRPSSRGSVDHAEERANRQFHPELQPGIKLLPSPIVHPNLAALATLAVADEHRSEPGLEVSLGERQGLADPKTGSREDDCQPSKAQSRRPLPAWRITATISSTRGGSAG